MIEQKLKGQLLRTYLVRARQLQQDLHMHRRDPSADAKAADRVRVRLDALALARALADGKDFEPSSGYPSLGKQSLLAACSVVPAELARTRLFSRAITDAVHGWLTELAAHRPNEGTTVRDAWPRGPGTGRRWARTSKVAKSWTAFQREHRKRTARGERATLEDLETAATECRAWLTLLSCHEFLQSIRPTTIQVYRLRLNALERAIARRRAQSAKAQTVRAKFDNEQAAAGGGATDDVNAYLNKRGQRQGGGA